MKEEALGSVLGLPSAANAKKQKTERTEMTDKPKMSSTLAKIEEPMELEIVRGLPLLSVTAVMQRREMITQIITSAMKEGIHYGVVPGTGRKVKRKNPKTNQEEEVEEGQRVIFKPGSQLLCSMFQFSPQYEIERQEYADGHITFWATCLLYHVNGAMLGRYKGACSTRESKWRYRWDSTGNLVPKEYWDRARDPMILGGTDFVARKAWIRADPDNPKSPNVSKWMIFHKVEHSDVSDYYNTCLKMGAKRSLSEAVVTATACSDMFSQDVLEEEEEKAERRAQEAEEERERERQRGPAADVRTDDAPEKASAGLWIGKIVKVEPVPYMKDVKLPDGTKAKEKAEYYRVWLENGWSASTFSTTIAKEATGFIDAVVKMETKKGSRANTFIVESVEEDKPEPSAADLKQDPQDLPFE